LKVCFPSLGQGLEENVVRIPFRFSLWRLTALFFVVFMFVLGGLVFPSLASVYEVGPGKRYAAILDVPLDTLEPGDIVKIFYRAKPYREKLIIRRSGTKARPIIITGVPRRGRFPVIDGAGAVQKQRDRREQSKRWLIKVGDDTPAEYVRIERLELRYANNTQVFRHRGKSLPYGDNAAGVLVEGGHHVRVSFCSIHGCGNGIQTAYAPKVGHLLIRGCWIYDNGNHADLKSSQEHNVYLCGSHSTVEFCRFDHTHADGNNIKDRGYQTVIRYNWIQESLNRQLDLVDHEGYRGADAYVYGNVIIQHPKPHNRTMIHWGGDGKYSRSGKLYFFNNTVIGKSPRMCFFSVDRADCRVQIRNNLFVGKGVLWRGTGALSGSHNWFSKSVRLSGGAGAFVLGVQGEDPKLCGRGNNPYVPCLDSPLVDNGIEDTPRPVQFMPSPNFSPSRRPRDGRIDLGAFEIAKGHGTAKN